MGYVLIINGLGIQLPNCGSGGRRFETDLPPLFLFLYFKSAQQTRIERSIKIS